MIEYKELSSLPYEPSVKAPKALTGTRRRYSSDCSYVYKAQLYTTKRGVETLIVSMYAPAIERPSGRVPAKWTLAEIHYLSSNGDFASSGYDDNSKELRRGSFRVGNGDFDLSAWYSCYNHNALIGEYASNNVKGVDNADTVIFDFITKHGLSKSFQKMRPHNTGIGWLADYQARLIDKKQHEAAKRKEERTFEKMRDFKAPPKEFETWVFSEALNKSTWFYAYDRKSKTQSGKCAACKKVSQLPNIKDNKRIECPKCHKKLICVNINAARYDHRAIIGFSTTASVKYIEHIGGNRFVSRTFDADSTYSWDKEKATCHRSTVLRECRRDFWSVENFKLRGNEYYNRYGYSDKWERVSSRWNKAEYAAQMTYPGNIIEITQSLGIKWIQNADLRPLCMMDIPFLTMVNAVAVAPAIENLGKMGLYQIARHYIADPYSGNTESSSPSKYLGADRPVLEGLAEFSASYEHLELWKLWKLTVKDMKDFGRVIRLCTANVSRMKSIVKRTGISAAKAANYLEKQRRLYKKDALMLWDDYLAAAIELGYDIKNNRDLICPPDIKKEHDRCTVLVEIDRNTENEQKYAERRKLLDRLSYSGEDYVIAPLANLEAFLKESRELDHCVKQYYKKCCEGKTNIFGLRKAATPDVPYFTVEISNDGVKLQNRGVHNCQPPKEVTEFTTKWLKQVNKRLQKFSLEPATEEKTRIGA